MKVQDYRKLAKEKELSFKIADLNAAREKILLELDSLGVEVGQDRVVSGGLADGETLGRELKQIEELEKKTREDLLAQQVQEILGQAREGSRFVALERKLTERPQWLRDKDLTKIYGEQRLYQKKQLEVFDYLEKHFAQFEVMGVEATLPEAGKRFFAQVVAQITGEMRELVTRGRELEVELEEKEKVLAKLGRREQRELEKIHREVGKNLTDDKVGSKALIRNNREYQQLLREIEMTKALQASLLNQVNVVIDLGIEELEVIGVNLASIVGQNQVTRELLHNLRSTNEVWEVGALKEKIEQVFGEFDKKIVEILQGEMDGRFGDGEMDESARRNFVELLEELLGFQEYLGQLMVDSKQVIESNMDDLKRARWEYGKLVLDFFSEQSPD